MIDLMTRAFLHPIDYSGVLRINTLQFRESVEETPGTHSFIFGTSDNLSWKAGQHALFMFPGKKIEGTFWRAFSVASSPHEKVIRIGTNIPDLHSDFKQKLLELTPGDTMRMFGPFGEFHATGQTQHIVGIAGGIGITPFRALAYEVAHGHLPHTSLSLIYSARDQYAYQGELDVWSQNSDALDITYVHTAEQVTATLHAMHEQFGNDADYYISGAPGMIKALRTTCKECGIKKIVNDPFKGY